jgi:hypothetical protein
MAGQLFFGASGLPDPSRAEQIRALIEPDDGGKTDRFLIFKISTAKRILSELECTGGQECRGRLQG